MKKILFSLFVCAVSLISFGYCDTVSYFTRGTFSINTNSSTNFSFDTGTCIFTNSYTSTLSFYDNNGFLVSTGLNGSNGLVCFDFAGYVTSSSTSSRTFYYYTGLDSLGGFASCPSCPTCPDCPSCDNIAHMGIFQGGNLIQGLDSNTGFYNLYLSDGLDFSTTPTAEGQNIYITGYNSFGSGEDFTGDLEFSNIYINDILHPGRQNIFVNIPDYITWDYNLTGDDFNIYVGSGYDQDYINSVIDINSYRPSSGDFTNIFVSGLTLVMPYIVILLFIIFIWKLIKRIFK